MKRLAVLYALILVGFALTVHAADGPEQFTLQSLHFTGIQSVSEKELAKTLSIQAPPIWKFWAKWPVFKREELQDDVLRIKQFYQERGYYNAKVDFRLEAGAAAEREAAPPAEVTFTVEEGPPTRTVSIRIDVTRKMEEPIEADLMKALPLKSGKTFTTADYRDAKEALLKVLKNKGYPLAELTGKVVVNTVENSARVSFELDPKRQYDFGPLHILPNDSGVRDIVIERAVTFHEGELFSADKVEQSQRNLFKLDVFRLALIKPEKPEPEKGLLPMAARLEPRKRNNLEFGIGYGSEDGLRLRGAWSYRNLWGWAGKFSVSAKHSDLVNNIQAEYTQPYFLDADNTLRGKAGFERDNYTSYTNQKVFAEAAIERKLWKNWVMAGSYNLEFNDLLNVRVTDPVDLEQLSRQNVYLISSLGAALTYSSVDDLLNPKKGNVFSVSGEWATHLLGSEVDYVMPAVELKRYQPLIGDFILAGRLRLATIKTQDPDSIPIFKRLFLGGSNTVRGYGFEKIPPLDENGNPLGGLSSGLGNLELRFPIYQKLTGVAFVDAGVLNADYLAYNANEIRYSCGGGIRYNTIVGPLRFDVGYKLNPPDIMPKPELWRVHFSIGQAF